MYVVVMHFVVMHVVVHAAGEAQTAKFQGLREWVMWCSEV